MDFQDAEIQTLVRRYRTFLDAHVMPLEAGFLTGGFAAVAAPLEAARTRAKADGLFAPQLPPELGGLGAALPLVGAISQVLGRTPLGHYVFHMQAPDVSNMELLLRAATPAQRERFLLPLTRGEIRSCFAMTEPDKAGSNPLQIATRAVRDGDDWVLDGRKWFTSSADGATFAITMAVSDPDAARPHERATFFIVPTDTPGFRLARNLPVMGHAGSGWASHGEVVFEGVRIPDTLRVGPVGAGFAMAQERLGPGRIHHAMRWLGIAERALELMVAHAATRELAPGVRLGHKDTVQAWIADSWVELEAARGLVERTALRIECEGQRAARLDISAIKLLVANVLDRVLDRAIQAHGALGMTDLTPLAFWYRHERAARIYDGPDEVHRALIGRELLERAGMPRHPTPPSRHGG